MCCDIKKKNTDQFTIVKSNLENLPEDQMSLNNAAQPFLEKSSLQAVGKNRLRKKRRQKNGRQEWFVQNMMKATQPNAETAGVFQACVLPTTNSRICFKKDHLILN